jgi:hypothetical protein
MSDSRKKLGKPRRPRREKARDIDPLVDRFVAAVNTGHREPVMVDIGQTPPSVLVGEADEYGFGDWQIKPYAAIDWVGAVEERLLRRFPAVYRSLITRYIFPGFEAGDVFFFANTPEGTEYYELRAAIFGPLASTLHSLGYLQIGNPADRSYDPVCFDPSRGDNHDRPLVRIDHEGIPINEVHVTEEVAPSLAHLMRAVIEAGGAENAEG